MFRQLLRLFEPMWIRLGLASFAVCLASTLVIFHQTHEEDAARASKALIAMPEIGASEVKALKGSTSSRTTKASPDPAAAAVTWSNFEQKEPEPVSEQTGEPESTRFETTIEPTPGPGPTPEFAREPTLAPTPKPTAKPTKPTPPEFYAYIGKKFFEDNMDNEASGIDVAPDGSHLVVASDDGKVFFLNLLDYDSGHCMVDLKYDSDIKIDGDRKRDFEGVAFDPTVWHEDDKSVYVVHEGADDDEPILFKFNYEYDNNGNCDIRVAEAVSLYGAIPCLPDSNGIESLSLKSPSSGSEPAVFFVGVQDTGKLYEVTSEGASAGSSCYDGGLGVEDLGASSYDGTYLWSLWGEEDQLTVVDPAKNCLLATYDIDLPKADKEGLLVDFANDVIYIAVDGQGDPSTVAVYNFTLPVGDLGTCKEEPEDHELCSNFEACGSAR